MIKNQKTVEDIMALQIEFQRMVGLPMDSIREESLFDMSEGFILKAIEELIEFRRTFPSSFNKYQKSQPSEIDRQRSIEEFCDNLLFNMNIAAIWKFSLFDILETLQKIQLNNFVKVKEKQMAYLNNEILRVPGKISGVGTGNLIPKYVFVGQNPGKTITQGYEFFSNPEDGASKVLLPILEKLGIRENCYMTNLVKSTTINNGQPDEELTKFWMEFFEREIKILNFASAHMVLIPMGNFARDNLREFDFPRKEYIHHPSYVLRGGMTSGSYEEEIKDVINISKELF